MLSNAYSLTALNDADVFVEIEQFSTYKRERGKFFQTFLISQVPPFHDKI